MTTTTTTKTTHAGRPDLVEAVRPDSSGAMSAWAALPLDERHEVWRLAHGAPIADVLARGGGRLDVFRASIAEPDLSRLDVALIGAARVAPVALVLGAIAYEVGRLL